MPSADPRHSTRSALAAALGLAGALLVACSSTPLPDEPGEPATVQPPATQTPPVAGLAPTQAPQRAAPASTAAATAAAIPASTPEVLTPLGSSTEPTPAVRQAYDGALKAMREGRKAEAEQSLRTLAQAHPELGGPPANLGLLLRQAGKLPEALAAFEQAAKANPREAVYQRQLGQTLRELGRFPEARAAYERAQSLNPQDALTALNLGVLLDLYLDDRAGATAQFQRYLALTPSGDAAVSKWLAELKNRKPSRAQAAASAAAAASAPTSATPTGAAPATPTAASASKKEPV